MELILFFPPPRLSLGPGLLFFRPADCFGGTVPVQPLALSAAFRRVVDVFGDPFVGALLTLALPVVEGDSLHGRHVHDCSASAH